jgi:methionyl-tRNA synthetase
MINKNCGAQVPEPLDAISLRELLDYMHAPVGAHGLLAEVRTHLQAQQFHLALDAIWTVVRQANADVDRMAPWALRKTDQPKMQQVLYLLAEVLRHLAIILQPFMPDSTAKILDQLAVPETARTFAFLNRGESLTDENSLEPGTPLPKPEGVFPRFVEEAAAS